MPQLNTVWEVATVEDKLVERISRECGVSKALAKVLCARGLTDPQSVQDFLYPDLHKLHDAFLLPDMDAAASRLARAIADGEHIRIYGDYDVDGITAVSLLVSVLRACGANVDYYIPNRLVEGYGLNADAVTRSAEDGVGLLVTVDCGIGAFDEVELASSLGLDVIITDHHEPGKSLPTCVAVVDPKRRDCAYPFEGLAGVGVAFKLASAVWDRYFRQVAEAEPLRYLDLVTLGTVADVVPLVDENRTIVSHGLSMMERTSNLGIRSLMAVSDLEGRALKAGHISFGLGPRINAAGRLGDPSLGARLFLTDSEEEANSLAAMLDEENRRRQEIEMDILRQVWEPVSKMNVRSTGAIVMGSPQWHSGVIGIVASKIAEMTFRPTVLVAFEGDVGRGSCRSVPGFNLYEALGECSDLLLKYGGHAQAAGISISADQLDAFRERLNEIGLECLRRGELVPTMRVDGELAEDEIDLELALELSRLEPFGLGNPSPVFVSRNMMVLECRQVGPEGRHLKVKLGRGRRVLDAIGFRLSKKLARVAMAAEEVDVAYSLEVNEWNGRTSVELLLKDLAESKRL
ncbi:MAG: single-stranded-DNA-specific exonuclease RecJ [Bacillota bacterium]|jgi:single-stranded-DNA-specific exonuclease|nr:single-stranded-DNA-specific exonuclease RecJ [Bacillota bacterium]